MRPACARPVFPSRPEVNCQPSSGQSISGFQRELHAARATAQGRPRHRETGEGGGTTASEAEAPGEEATSSGFRTEARRRTGAGRQGRARRAAQQAAPARRADAKARALEIKALVEQNKLPKKLESEDRFNFVAGKKLRFILVDAAMREGLNNGSLFIIRYDGKSEVVPAAIAEKIRERDERAVVKLNSGETAVDENDPYKDFVVPDDLKW